MKDKTKEGSVNDFRSEQYVKRIKRKHGLRNRNIVFMPQNANYLSCSFSTGRVR